VASDLRYVVHHITLIMLGSQLCDARSWELA
jgi:hypothetical protein